METQDLQAMPDFSPEYWFAAWRQSMKGETETVTRGHSTVEFWDNMSRDYDQHDSDKSRKRFDESIADLERRGFLSSRMRILDVGCGTGRMAIALAKRGAEVTALDFSGGMLDQLRANISGDAGAHMTVVQDDWTTMDLEKRGWVGHFDLVMAHMTPAIRTPDNLMKLIVASRKKCLLKTWAEKRRSAILDKIWRMFSGTEPTKRPAPLVYIFNAIFSMGFHPSLDFESLGWEREQGFDDALEQYVSYARGMFDHDEAELRERIGEYLGSIAVNGVIADKTDGWTGRMLWTID